uniref:Serum response factor n=2 Tax=Echinococcus granulosus TaxID=6210 RepID=A0A068WV79_ECHGR|nr:serum response factor [Echinococcus granulosus]
MGIRFVYSVCHNTSYKNFLQLSSCARMADIKFFSENPADDIFTDDEDVDSSFNQSFPSQPHASSTNGDIPLKRRKLTRGKQKIPISFMQDRVRRCSTFSKRKTGLMKKAFELAELTGAEVLLLVASETNHVYTFTTNRLKAIIDSDQGRELIQSCLGSRGQTTTSSPSLPAPPSASAQLQPAQSRDEESDGQGDGRPSPTEAEPQTLSIQMIDGTLLHLPVTFPGGSDLVLPFLPTGDARSRSVAGKAVAPPPCLTVANGENQPQLPTTTEEKPAAQ